MQKNQINLYRNAAGYSDKTAGEAISNADTPPENVTNFRKAIKLLCSICHVRVKGKIVIVDEKGRRW